MLQGSSILDLRLPFLAILQSPLRQQQSWQNRIDSRLGTLG
jgi:hypothetical protein